MLQDSIAVRQSQTSLSNANTLSTTRMGNLQPVIGLAMRIPFGGPGTQNCDKFIDIENAMIRLNKANEMFELGLIDQDQLEEISSKAFAVLNDF